jgi:4-diphosphocytidyl-2-C-methyl-D-erythritol kinase
MNRALTAQAPGKVNLCLRLGEPRSDGLHELVSAVQAVSLADELTLEPGSGPGDEVVCPEVEGDNLAAAALAAFREASGWDAPPQRLRIVKRIPVAGGMGGGSSDAAAALRLAAQAAGRRDDHQLLERIAPQLGADVPALLRPGLRLVTGAGEHVSDLPALERFWIVALPLREPLATGDVYAEADRLGLPRPAAELDAAARELETALGSGGRLPLEVLHNDLEPAARSLCPAIDDALAALGKAGAEAALVSGSGPTTFGVFRAWKDRIAGVAASLAMDGRFADALVAYPVAQG